jgi:acetyl esterase
MLWVPWLDMSKQSRSYQLFAEGFFLEKAKMEWYTDLYLSKPDDALDPMASPLLGDVDGVCPAVLLIAGFDPLRDEGLAYGEKLKAAGVPTVVRLFDGLVHPFINVAGYVPAANAAFSEATRHLRERL